MGNPFNTKEINKRFFSLIGEKKRIELAALLGVGQSMISTWVTGKKQVPWDKLAYAKELSGKSWDWMLGATEDAGLDDEISSINQPTPPEDMPQPNALLPANIDDEKPAQRFPALGKAAAKDKFNGNHGGFSEDQYVVWDDITIPETTHFIQVSGDSMDPMILDGQYAMVGPQYFGKDAHLKSREIVIVQVSIADEGQAGMDGPWEGVYCKRIQDGGDIWHFTSINPAGESFTAEKANCRIWPVIGVYFAGRGRIPEED